MEPIYLPQTASHPIPDNGLTQLLAHGHTHPVLPQPVLPGIQHQKTVAMPTGGIETAKDVVELQGFGEFHFYPPKIGLPGQL
jgi:hypothetical protein